MDFEEIESRCGDGGCLRLFRDEWGSVIKVEDQVSWAEVPEAVPDIAILRDISSKKGRLL